jgi:hypothetical protein
MSITPIELISDFLVELSSWIVIFENMKVEVSISPFCCNSFTGFQKLLSNATTLILGMNR